MATVKYHGDMLALTGKKEENCEASDLAGVIKFIKKEYGARAAKTAKKMLIVVDATSMLLLDGYKTAINDKSTVSFLPVCGGG